MRGIALLRNARIQNANDVVNLAFGYASEEDRLELKKKFVPGLLSFPFSDDVDQSNFYEGFYWLKRFEFNLLLTLSIARSPWGAL